MLYNTISITPQDDGTWKVSVHEVPEERDEKGPPPNAQGFYHYPRKMGEEEAFRKLRNLMVKRHREEIKDITESMESLQKLTFGKK